MLEAMRIAAAAALVMALAAPVPAATGEEPTPARPRSATTQVVMGRRRVPLSSLAPGQRVRVTYTTTGGRGVATRVSILGPRLTREGRPG